MNGYVSFFFFLSLISLFHLFFLLRHFSSYSFVHAYREANRVAYNLPEFGWISVFEMTLVFISLGLSAELRAVFFF